MLRVIVHVPDGEDRKFRFSQWRTVVGRSRSCDLTLVSSQVSKTHAAIEILDGAVTIRDLGSRNGIEVNSVPVTRQTVLRPGDRVTFGDVTISIDPDSAVFHGGVEQNDKFSDLLQQERELRSSGHQPIQDFHIDPTRLAVTETEREASAIFARPIVGASGNAPVLRVLRITEDFIPRSAYRIEPFRIELDTGEPAWIQPLGELAVVDLQGFTKMDQFWFEEPEDSYDMTNGRAILLRTYYAIPEYIRIFSAVETGYTQDGTKIFSERSNVEPLAILPVTL